MSKLLYSAGTAFSLALAAPGLAQTLSLPASAYGPAIRQSVVGDLSESSRSDSPADVTAKLISLAQEWVSTWNDKNVDRMQQLHDGDFLYGIYGRFMDGQNLLKLIRKENFWGLTYTLKMVEPQVRMLAPDTALVLFQLAGKSVGPKGERPYASLFTLVYKKRGEDWKIVHVHDSEQLESNS